MSQEVNVFPSNKTEALAFLYLQNQDLSKLTPEEVFDKYQDAYDKIKEHRKKASGTSQRCYY